MASYEMLRSPSQNDAHRQPPPPIPPSPTLTNPDMILPCDEGERENKTPSPPFNLPSLSHLQNFYQRHTPGDYGADSGTDTPIGLALSLSNNNNTRAHKKNFPRHTWTHEGHDASRRLSDIGEEDSASSPSYLGTFATNLKVNSQARLAASPVLHGRTEEGGYSSSSSSTVSPASEREPEDQEKSKATGHSLHMGVNDVQLDAPNGEMLTPKNPVAVAREKGPGDEFSSAILSSEAERILENAKKRLTLMEGNLTRARSSMRSASSLSASPSPSPAMSLGPHQPVGGLYRSISHTSRKPASQRPRSIYSTVLDAANNRHSRVHSETTLPSDEPQHKGLSRSMSAMGSSTSSFYNDEKSFRYEPTRAYLTHRASTSSFQPSGNYAPSPNHAASPVKEDTPPDTPKGLGITTKVETKINNMEDFNSVYPFSDPPSRTQSQLQVRDLQDQMKGLHIKISSLKVKTQEDNLRRRSLQSLRTPSPLNNGDDQWYGKVMEYKNSQDSLKNTVAATDVPEQQKESEPEPEPESNEYEGVPAVTVSANQTDEPEPEPEVEADFDDRQSVMESLYEDAEEGEYPDSNSDIDREALNEILREPLDDDLKDSEPFPPVPPIPNNEARPHEEREDAFDYEHFILHSALGNFTQTRMRRPSNASNASVETTRPIQGRRSVKHSRNNSANSLSTVASFATATEGERHDDIQSVLYWDRKFNDELRSHDVYPESINEQESGLESDTMRTPRATRRSGGRENLNPINTNLPSSGSLPLPQRSDSATAGSATPTSLASSLVSTVRAASSPHPSAAERGDSGMNNDDERLLEQLFESLGSVCMDLQSITTSSDPDPKSVKVLRRRLDAARRVLDGELDT